MIDRPTGQKNIYNKFLLVFVNITRMTTSTSSETQEIRPLSYLGAEKITFPPKPDGQTVRHTDGRTFVFLE